MAFLLITTSLMQILVFARVLRGKSSAEFSVLSADTGRNIIMLMDSDGIRATFSKGGSVRPLERINNLGIYLKLVYGRDSVVAQLFQKYLPELRSSSFGDLQARSGQSEVLSTASLSSLTLNSSIWEEYANTFFPIRN